MGVPRWVRMSLRLGAFNDLRSRAKLLSTGVDVCGEEPQYDLMNLLSPAVQGVPWMAEVAKAVARHVDEELLPEYDALMMAGVRVAAAFGFRDARTLSEYPLQGGRRALVLPHPSGLCRIWNSDKKVAECSAAVARTLQMEVADAERR